MHCGVVVGYPTADRIALAVEQILLPGTVAVALRLVGLVELPARARILRRRALRVVRHALVELLLQLALLQFVAQLLLLRVLLEPHVRRHRPDHRLRAGLLPGTGGAQRSERQRASQQRA